jgi:hypothetical protein
MNPQQTPYQPPPPPGANYDFFLNPQKPPKPSPFAGLLGGGSLAVRMAVVACGAFVVVIVLYIFLSLFGNSSDPKLLTIAQDQSELSRVAALAYTLGQNQSSSSTQNFARSANLSLTTEQLQLLNYLKEHGTKFSAKQLAATKNTSTDTELSSSIQSSSFDSTYASVMQSQLGSYQITLQSAFKSASSTNLKVILAADYKAAGLLLRQINNPDQ